MNISSNNFNITDKFDPLFEEIYLYSVNAAIPLTVTGLLVNLLMLYVFIMDKFFHRRIYLLMLISTISDASSTIASIVGYSVLADKNLNVQTGSIICKFFLFVISTSYGISMMSLSLIAMDRYFAIVRPFFRFYAIYKNQIIVLTEIFIWILSISVCAPMLAVITSYSEENYIICDFSSMTPSMTVYLVIFVLILYIVPSAFIGIFYWRIIKHQKNYIKPGQTMHKLREQQMKRRKLIRMLISIAFTYILITWPVFASIFGFAVTQTSLQQLRDKNLVLFFLAFFSVSLSASITVINPFIYIKFDDNIRSKLRHFWYRFDIFKSNRVGSINNNLSVHTL